MAGENKTAQEYESKWLVHSPLFVNIGTDKPILFIVKVPM
jgi:hypothetical protein